MNKLLIIKSGNEYLRFQGQGFELSPLNKASVFPLGQVEEARNHCAKLAAAGIAVRLMKLTIIEEPYVGEE